MTLAKALRQEATAMQLHAEKASKIGQHGAAVNAFAKAADLRIRAAVAETVAGEEKRLKTPLQRAHAARMRAQADSSHIAAGKYLKEEEALRAEKFEAEKAAIEAKKRKRERTPETALAELIAVVADLDDDAQEQILDAIADRRRSRLVLAHG
jgi:hypothetical protein